MFENLTNQKKVCHVTSAHPRYDVRIFHKECKSLANNGFDVTLLVNDNLPNEAIDGVKIVSTKMKPRNRYERMIKSKKRIKALILEVDADIYHFHDPELLPEAAWIKKRKKKVVFDFHEDVSEQIFFKDWIPYGLRKFVSTMYRSYEKKIIKEFDGIISVTPKFVSRLVEINPHTVMITNYPIVDSMGGVSSANKGRKICFAGGISSQWNHEKIINAIETIDELEYILAGNGEKEYIEKLKKLKGWNKVRFLGRIPHERVKEVYDESMIGMTILSYDTQVGDEGTLGNTKIFEFMAAGIPVICSNNKLWKEIIEKYECGISVNPESEDDIRNAIQRLLNDQECSKEMGRNGREAIITEYNWKTQSRELIEFYNRLLKYSK